MLHTRVSLPPVVICMPVMLASITMPRPRRASSPIPFVDESTFSDLNKPIAHLLVVRAAEPIMRPPAPRRIGNGYSKRPWRYSDSAHCGAMNVFAARIDKAKASMERAGVDVLLVSV